MTLDFCYHRLDLGGPIGDKLKRFAPLLEVLPPGAGPAAGYHHYNLANYPWRWGRPEEAMAEYRRAVEAKPRWDDALLAAWLRAKELGLVEEATMYLERLCRVRPEWREKLELLSKKEEARAGSPASQWFLKR